MREEVLARHVLFVHNARTSFVQDDIDILAGRFNVTEWFVRSRFRLRLPQLLRLMREIDVVYCWFASWHSLLPVLLARMKKIPVIVVTGGYDTANVPEAGYGSQRGGIRKFVTNSILHKANILIANSNAACEEICKIKGVGREKVRVIYHGVRPFPFISPEMKEQIALTVGGVWHENLLRKGLLPFVQAAKFLPDWKFILVGKWHDDSIETLKADAASNVYFTGFVSDEELAGYFSRASVYVQVSLHEGFGLSVAEAMTAGCWPVISNVCSLPEVIGKHGIILDHMRPESIAHAVIDAYESNGRVRLEGARWINDRYSLSVREERLIALINGLRVG